MRIELTVVGPLGRHDVAVEAAAAVPLAAVLPALAATVGAGPGAPAASAGVRLDPAAPLGASGLRTGGDLSFGGPTAVPVSGGLDLALIGGAPSGPAVPLRRGRITLGRGADCDVVLTDDRASRRHATLEIERGCVLLRDLGSTNGTSIDGVTVGAAGAVLDAGQVLRVGDSLFAIDAPVTPAVTTAGAAGTVVVNRPPRPAPAAGAPPIDLPEAAVTVRPGRVQWITALVPAAAGAGFAWVLDAPQFLVFALLSPVLLLSGALGDRVHWRRARRRAAVESRRRAALTAARIAEELGRETATRRDEAPDPASVLRTATLPGVRLWERRVGDPDHLLVRLGSADLPSRLRVRAAGAEAPAGVVPTVPVTVGLADGPVGLAGPAEVVSSALRWIVAQLVALHPAAELEIVLLVGAARREGWRWCRWLPHLRSPPAGSDEAAAAVVAGLAARLERRRRSRDGPGPWPRRWVVLVVDGVPPDTLPGLADVLADGPRHGLTAVCAAADPRALPAACRTVAVVHDGSGSRLSVRTPTAEVEVIADRVGPWWASTLARGLAPFVDPDTAGRALPDRVRLGDLLASADDARADTAAVLRAWAAADGGAHTVIGRCADGPVTLDLVGDGPHALIAGTTGSGKSELLRSLVVGLAATHPPDAVTFLLVDYKGGAAFADCARLPHTVGLVTDLDPGLTRRALRSLHAELKRRERLLAQVGAVDLADYRGRGPAALARLVIVVDEFAELSAELPDFVSGLIGVARRGRSLGVHLVLATQRPGSAVSAEIRANTSLRIALRVTDVGDSTDVIDAPDAAGLDPARPGRAFLRTGRGLIGLQTAAVLPAPVRTDTPVVRRLDGWRRCRDPATGPAGPAGPAGSATELADVVDLVARSAAHAGLRAAQSPWLPPLPPAIPLATVLPAAPGVGIGLLDAPDDLAQPTLTLDPRIDGSVLVAGRRGAGRTGALLTIGVASASSAGPGDLHVHVIDGSGVLAATLAGLPHLGTVVTTTSAALVPVLLARLIAAAGGPRTLLLVDDWDGLLADRDEVEAAEWADLLSRLLRSGASAGVTVVVAGGRSLLQPRTAAGFAVRLVLRLADRDDYGLAGLSARDIPTDLPPGGGVRAADGAQFQLAHPGATPGVAGVREAVAELARRRPRTAAGPRPLQLRDLPVRLTLPTLRARLPAHPAVLLGLAGDTAAPCAVDLVGTRARLLLAGPPRSGRTTALLTVLAETQRLGHRVVVLAPDRSPLSAAARRCGVRVLDPTDAPGAAPDDPTVLLVDDDEVFAGTAAGEALVGWLRATAAPLAVVVAARSDDLITTYRGVAAEVRRGRCGILLRPGPVDGELLGVRTSRSGPATGGPGRGVIVGDPAWGPLFAAGGPLPIQLALPDEGAP